MDRRFRLQVAAAFATLYLVWGSTYLGIRYAVESLPPFTLAGARFIAAGTLMLAWSRWRGAPWPAGRQWLGATGVGICLVVLSNAPIVWVEQEIDSGVVALFAAGTPLMISLFNRIRIGTPLPLTRIVGLLLGTAGLVVLGGAAVAAVPDPLRVMVLVMAMFAWAFGSTWGRGWPHPENIITASGAQMLTGGIIATAVGAVLGEWRNFDPAAVTKTSVVAWLYLTTFGSMLAYTAYQWLLAHIDASRVASYNYVNPVVALALGVLIAGEQINSQIVVATALLIPAVVLVVMERKERPVRPAG